MEKTNRLFMIWGVLVVIIVVLLTFLGFMLKKNDETFSKLEEKLVAKAEKYVDANFLYPKEGLTTKVTTDELIEKEYLDNLRNGEDVCKGYVIVSKDMVYKYKAYIKCEKYTTKGYEE